MTTVEDDSTVGSMAETAALKAAVLETLDELESSMADEDQVQVFGSKDAEAELEDSDSDSLSLEDEDSAHDGMLIAIEADDDEDEAAQAGWVVWETRLQADWMVGSHDAAEKEEIPVVETDSEDDELSDDEAEAETEV